MVMTTRLRFPTARLMKRGYNRVKHVMMSGSSMRDRHTSDCRMCRKSMLVRRCAWKYCMNLDLLHSRRWMHTSMFSKYWASME